MDGLIFLLFTCLVVVFFSLYYVVDSIKLALRTKDSAFYVFAALFSFYVVMFSKISYEVVLKMLGGA